MTKERLNISNGTKKKGEDKNQSASGGDNGRQN